MQHKVEDLYYFCLAHLQAAALGYNQGKVRWEVVLSLGGETLRHIQQLHDSGLDVLLNLPQA